MDQYVRRLPAKPVTTIRFFDRRDYYNVFGDDAIFVAQEIRLTEEVLKKSQTGLTYVNISQSEFESDAKELLLLRQYRVEMHSRESGCWKLQFTCSPGNITPLEDILYSAAGNLDSRGLVALSCSSDGRTCGLTFVDNICRTIRVVSFSDDEKMSALECLMIQLGPKESVLPHNMRNLKHVKSLLELNQITVSVVKANDYFVSDPAVVSDLKHILLPKTNFKQVEHDVNVCEYLHLLVFD